MKIVDRIGKKHNRLTIVEAGHGACKCVCDCGAEWTGPINNVIRGYTKSCGCLRREASSQRRSAFKMSEKCIYCGGKYYSKGMCRRCYGLLKRNGAVAYKKERSPIFVPEVSQ